jgi:hypothetical protein
LSAHEAALQRRLAAIEKLRDEAIETGNTELLDRADQLELEARERFARQASHLQPAVVQPDAALAPASGATEEVPGRPDFERGLGRETARQARGVLDLPGHDWSSYGPGAPGFGRRTAQERRDLRTGALAPVDPTTPPTTSEPVDPSTLESPMPLPAP